MSSVGLTIGSLFSGVGGLDLGLELAGLGPVLFQVETNDHARSVLARHWPDTERHRDVRDVGRGNLPRVDVLCGGSPCPGFSRAGAQRGLADPRSGLWREFDRLVGEVGPAYVVFENVAQVQTLHGGRHFRRIVDDLAARGYASAWWRDTAAAAGAPHLRERVWLVGWQLGDADVARLAGRRLPGPERPDGGAARAADRAGAGVAAGGDQPGLGRDALRAADRLDQDRWPAGRGAPPHAWEPPRTTLDGRGRRARLTALGNIALPANARVAGELIVLLEDRRRKGLEPWTTPA